MNARLYAELENALERWMSKNAGRDDWPNCIFGQMTIRHMAQAAAAVVDACEESQQYAEREGFVAAK